jgi:hypothetical protein
LSFPSAGVCFPTRIRIGFTDDKSQARGLGDCWECPCGPDPLKKNSVGLLRRAGVYATPTRTLVSMSEPFCPFCGEAFREEWRVSREGQP